MSKFFTSRKIFDNVTQIGGLGGELCYLIEGSEKALLIDGLTGVGSLKAFTRMYRFARYACADARTCGSRRRIV